MVTIKKIKAYLRLKIGIFNVIKYRIYTQFLVMNN